MLPDRKAQTPFRALIWTVFPFELVAWALPKLLSNVKESLRLSVLNVLITAVNFKFEMWGSYQRNL